MERQQKWFKIQYRDYSEVELIKQLADNRGLTMSDLVRQLVLAEKQRQESEGLLAAQTSFFAV